ncbi:MAG: polysaccharide deacetylase family protein [Phycisphaeraceae bacterium]
MREMMCILLYTLPCLLFAGTALAAVEPGAYVARYRGDANAAFSFTFDDGFRQEVEDALSVLDVLDIKGTFFVMPLAMDETPNHFVTWDRLREMQANGHEIGTHARTRPRLHEVDDETVRSIVNGGWDLIRDELERAPVSFAYPGGTRRDARLATIVGERHPFIRTQAVGYGSAGNRVWRPAEARAEVREAQDSGGWIKAVVHSIVGGYSPFESIDEFREHCEWLAEQGDELWIAPMGEVGRYVALRDAARLEVLAQGPGHARLRLVCDAQAGDVDDARLTVVIPATATEATATTADGAELPVTVREGHVLVEVPADATVVEVHWV